jgi:hypothetical protein
MKSLIVLAAFCSIAVGQAQQAAVVLDVEQSGWACCDDDPDSLFLRIYDNGVMEWETIERSSASMVGGKEQVQWKKLLHRGKMPGADQKLFKHLLAAPELRSYNPKYVFNTYIDTSITERIRITTPVMTKEITVTNFYPFLHHPVRKYPGALARLVCAIDHRAALNTNYDDRAEQTWCTGKSDSIRR